MHLFNVEGVIDVVIGDVIQKDLKTHLLIYHLLQVSVYNMKMQLLTYNTSEKYLMKKANSDRPCEVSLKTAS